MERKKIAWLACTFSVNGATDARNQVLNCYSTNSEGQNRVANLIQALRPSVDALIVTPHWGDQYTAAPANSEMNLARQFIAAGATAVIGAHPHVIQPMERIPVVDGSGTLIREALVAYSLGNFVSGQEGVDRNTAMILYFNISFQRYGATISSAAYVPTFMNRDPGYYNLTTGAQALSGIHEGRLGTSIAIQTADQVTRCLQ